MIKIQYRATSPYFQTGTFGNFLDVMSNRNITKNVDDVLYEIDKVYEYRPDMLAFDLYGDSALWWVFAQRNPNVIEDPIYDFSTGKTIQLPKLSNLRNDLGF